MTFTRPPWTPPQLEHDFVHASGEATDDLDPATGAVVARVRQATAADADVAVRRAKAAFTQASWRNNGALRSRVLHRYAERLREHTGELAELLTREQGKTLGEARSEILGSADMVDYYAGLARAVYGRSMALSDTAHGVVVREPAGVVVVITPWNWPLTLLERSLAPALAAGNACVVKPASLTPAITVAGLALLAQDPELTDGILTCVTGPGREIGDALVGHPDVDMIAFTGESGTGAQVMRTAAAQAKKVALELGGKSPNLVFADANLDKALDGAMNAIFTTSGQICTAGSRLLVEATIYDEFTEGLVKRVGQLRLGDPMDPDTTLGPLVSAAQARTVTEYIDIGRAEGTLLAGGTLLAADDARPEGGVLSTGHFVAPTVIADLPAGSRVVREEVFGPVLTVHRFADEAEAIRLAEDTEFGLAAGIWTRDLDRAWRVGRAVRSGTVWINTYHHFYPEAEVGGFRGSGLGRQQGVDGLLEFTETKHLNFDSSATLW
ncbi:MAG TPA: aldehyde dehydrogenase family protein [Streptosporangiaceae bacterium]|jgi:betaine-aldehyde dehydrogenase